MKKSTKVLKKFAALFLVVLMSIDSLAAIVSDNNGAAFITKAEYDSLKNEFMRQVTSINTNIDNKLNDAIQSYLDGIKQAKIVERGRLVNSNSWIMWTNADYPKYTEGKPYLHGVCASGHWQISGVSADTGGQATEASSQMVTWASMTINGKAAYKTNGGFKKHFLKNPKTYKDGNGTDIYAGMYNGYWIDEGEDIAFGYWAAKHDSYWALAGEQWLMATGNNTFENLTVDATGTSVYPNMEFGNTENGNCTGQPLGVQAAERITGKQSYGQNISTYDAISDNRFFDIDGQNKVGITTTSPAILRQDKTSVFKTWFNDVMGVSSIAYAAFYPHNYDSTNKVWKEQYCNVAVQYDNVTFTTRKNASDTARANLDISYLKMANVPYNIQFYNVWSQLTDSAASTAYEYLNKSDTNLKAGMKANIKNALILETDDDGKIIPHLSMKAGYPLIDVKKNEKVNWDVTTGTTPIRMMAKYGPFSIGTTNPTSDCDVLFTNTDGSTSSVLNIPANTTYTVRLTAAYDGPLFFKWASSSGGSAEIKVSKNPKVELAEGGTA